MSSLEITLVYLLAAVLGVVAFRMLKLPPMLGYLVVGVLVGPHALGLGDNTEGLRHIGEFDVHVHLHADVNTTVKVIITGED